MSVLFTAATNTAKAFLPFDPTIPDSKDARRDIARYPREDNWENEGGYIASARSVIASSAYSVRDIEVLEVQVRVMQMTLASDFADGRVGMHYNSYAHRSRVLRQQKAKLDALQVSIQSQEQRP
jgi:hypothetical protein